ncbi:DUF3857 domain-containing protein [Bdellovibrio sp. HCB274]|uniref:DUF3857 domain-containing protein n=1 Tax=Bdellovibrio sp. HCB274 TaxID=3394361 RepID=UPI0039B42D26
MKTLLLSMTSLFLILISLNVHADWMSEQEAPFTIVNTTDTVTVDKNGLSESIVEAEMQVLNESGRNELVLQKIPFLPDASTVTFIKASTITEGVESAVNAKDVTVRAAKGPAQGLSHVKELVIPFNNLKIGSITKYTVKIKYKKNVHAGLFNQSYVIGLHAPEKAGKIKIKSLLPLYHQITDPWKVLNKKESREGEFYVFEIEQTKPLFKVPKEPLAVLNADLVTRVDISTMNDWNTFVKPLAKKYEDILAVKTLPAPFTRIVTKAKKGKTTAEKINIVTSELASIMTYSGNWTSLDKMVIAQPLKDISRVKTGDCKDFSLATTAMLRSLGLDAKVALVRRTSTQEASQITMQTPPSQVVMASAFNHAIVKVKEGDRTYWVDPTNIVSNAEFVFSDIAGSGALEVSALAKNLETVPFPTASQSRLTFDKTIKINLDRSSDTVTNFEALGDYAKYVTESSFGTSEEAAKKTLMNYLRNDNKNAKGMYEGFSFRNRVANSITGTQKTIGEEIVKWEDQKLLLNIGFPLAALTPMALTGYRVTPANLLGRFSESTVTHVNGYDFVGYELGCNILTPWYRITREFIKEEKGFKVVDEVVFDKVQVSSEELNSDKFQYMLGSLAECMKSSVVKITPLAAADTLQSRLDKYTVQIALDKLALGGPKSIQGAREAFHITGQILSQDSENKDALLVRAQAVRRVNYINNSIDDSEYINESARILDVVETRHPQDPKVLQQKTWVAVYRNDKEKISGLFNQAYKTSPKDYDLYKLGGRVLEDLKQIQAAIGSYTKAFELARNQQEKATAAASLGHLLITNNQIENGVNYYKYAIKADPGNSWLAGNFAALIQTYGRWDDSIAVGEEVVKTNPYGMAKTTLAKAYSGKADIIMAAPVNNPLDQAKNLDASEKLYAKGLTHAPGNEECLLGLSRVYHIRATVDLNPMTAQKSLRYLEKALESKKVSIEKVASMKKDLLLIADGKKPTPRLPAAANTPIAVAEPVKAQPSPVAPTATPIAVVVPAALVAATSPTPTPKPVSKPTTAPTATASVTPAATASVTPPATPSASPTALPSTTPSVAPTTQPAK